MADYRQAALSDSDRAICDFVVKLTETPQAMKREDVAKLREQGLDDPAIHDVAQIAAMFAYYNRLAQGLGVDPEAEWDS